MSTTLLALETATSACSVAIMEDGTLLAEASLHRARVHAEQLTPLVHDLLARSEQTMAELDAIAVSMGPGSYTGLRIGVSTAKGLALATGGALIGVPTLEALAASVSPYARDGDVVSAVLDARRNEVYAAAYQIDDGALVPFVETSALTVGALADRVDGIDGPLWLVGNGSTKAAAALQAAGLDLRTLTDDIHAPSAAWVARRAWPRFQRGMVDDVAAFEPYYLKAFAGTEPAQTPFERLPF